MPTDKRRRESSAGFHFINLYQCCRRKFYFRYLKRLKSKITAQPLVLGGAYHEGKSIFYKTKSETKALAAALAVVEEAKKELESKEVYREIVFRVSNLLKKWVTEIGSYDLKVFKILANEEEFKVPVANTDVFVTLRPDQIIKSKVDKTIYILETKTTSFSSLVTEKAVYYGDQATMYLWGVAKATKWKPYAVLPDIAFWSKNTSNVDRITLTRGELITRPEHFIEAFEKGLSQTITEINQLVTAYKEGYDPEVLFPRNTHYCLSFSTVCQFAGICMEDCERKGWRKPDELIVDRSIKTIGSYVEDQIAQD